MKLHFHSGIFIMNQIAMLNYAKLKNKIVHSLYSSRAVRIHFARPEYYTHGDIFNVSYILLFYGCLFLVCVFVFVLLCCVMHNGFLFHLLISFVWSCSCSCSALCRHIDILCSKCYIEQHGQPKQNYNDATRPSTVHSHIYTHTNAAMRLCFYTLHNFTLCTTSETLFARSRIFSVSVSLGFFGSHNPPDVFAIIYN